jgi:hypothetical protein
MARVKEMVISENKSNRSQTAVRSTCQSARSQQQDDEQQVELDVIPDSANHAARQKSQRNRKPKTTTSEPIEVPVKRAAGRPRKMESAGKPGQPSKPEAVQKAASKAKTKAKSKKTQVNQTDGEEEDDVMDAELP